MTPVAFYIDGFNLYHALDRSDGDRAKWLDLMALAKRLILPASETITGVFYFSAYAHWLPEPMARHEAYVKELAPRASIALWDTSRTSIVTARIAGRAGSPMRKRKPM